MGSLHLKSTRFAIFSYFKCFKSDKFSAKYYYIGPKAGWKFTLLTVDFATGKKIQLTNPIAMETVFISCRSDLPPIGKKRPDAHFSFFSIYLVSLTEKAASLRGVNSSSSDLTLF